MTLVRVQNSNLRANYDFICKQLNLSLAWQ